MERKGCRFRKLKGLFLCIVLLISSVTDQGITLNAAEAVTESLLEPVTEEANILLEPESGEELDDAAETNIELSMSTNSESSTESNISTNSETSTESGISTNSETGTESSITTNSESSTESSISTNSETDTESSISTNSETDTESDSSTESKNSEDLEAATEQEQGTQEEVNVSAVSEEDFEYTVDEYDKATITKYHGSASTLIIPETLGGYSVMSISSKAFQANTSIQSVEMPDCIETIGVKAFEECTSLSSVKLSKGLTTIGSYAFHNCDLLIEIEIPKSLENIISYGGVVYGAFNACDNLKKVTFEDKTTQIARGLFQGCSGLEEIVIPDTVTTINKEAFENCKNLKNVLIPESVTKIDEDAFYGCICLKAVIIPKNVKELIKAFEGCTGLEEVTISDGVESIGNSAFAGCTALTRIELPDSVLTIETAAFSGCTNLVEVVFSNYLTRIGSKAFRNCTALAEIELPDSVITIDEEAFDSCTNVEKVILSKNVATIGYYAFHNCTSLTQIEIPKSLEKTTTGLDKYGIFVSCKNLKAITFEKGTTRIAENLFANCSGLEEITITDTVTVIEDSAFLKCENLKNVHIPNSLTNIERYAFAGCTALSEVIMPDSITTIGKYAFQNCTNLSKLILSKGVEFIGYYAFWQCNSLTEIEIPKSLQRTGTEVDSGYGVFVSCDALKKICFEEGATKVANGLFRGCLGIKEIIIPESVTTIEFAAFCNCMIKTLTLPNSIKTIEKEAFRGCTGFTEIIIPDSVEEIGESAFRNCSDLEHITIEKGVQTIDKCAFSDCTSLQEISLPDSVTLVKTSAFENCVKLSQVVFSNGLQEIGAGAFYNTGLEELTIPESVTEIWNGAFMDCISLSKVTLSNGLKTIGSYAFKNCEALTSIVVPDSVIELGSELFAECDLLSEVTLGTGITEIPISTFELCVSLPKITLPYRIAKIDENAFRNCASLTEVYIPRATTEIADKVFDYVAKLKIYGIAGTYAETYAAKIGAVFVPHEINAQAVTLDKTELSIPLHEKIQLIMCVTPSDFTDEVSWRSSDTSVITVSETGEIYAEGLGSATVKVTVGNVSAACKITVCQSVASISLNKYTLSLEALETFSLIAEVSPSEADNKEVAWSTSDSAVAAIDETGLITALAKGSAVITVTALDGSGVSQSCAVTVVNNGYLCASAEEMESEHNYSVNSSDFWIYNNPNAKKLAVTFDERTNLEEDFDYLYIYNAEGTEVGKYTGTQLAGKTIEIEGSTLKIKLISDNAGTAWGFKVQKITVLEEGTNDICTVIFDTQGGSEIPSISVEKGTCVQEPDQPVREGYCFVGWMLSDEPYDFRKPVIQDIVLTAKWEKIDTEPIPDDLGEVLPEDVPADGMIPNKIWMAGLQNGGCFPYTGNAVTPQVRIYDGKKRLIEKIDYTVSYKNNIKVGTAAIVVTCKGNYAGKQSASFSIQPIALTDSAVYAVDFYVKISQKAQKPIPELYYMGTRMKNKKDFTVQYSNTFGVYAQAGEYTVTVTGKGNFTGERKITLTAVEHLVKNNTVSISKAHIAGFEKAVRYTGSPIMQHCTLTVKGADGNEKTLVEGMDYFVSYSNNQSAGTAAVIYYGKNGYAGKLKKTFKITAYDLQKNQENKITYNSQLQGVYAKGGSKPIPDIYFNGERLKEGVDYTVSYKNNKTVSGRKTPCVIVKGKGCFRGKISIPFTIVPQDLSKMTLVSPDKIYKNKGNQYQITPKLMDLDGKMLTVKKDFDKNSIQYQYAQDVLLENGVSKKAGEAVENTDIIPVNTQIRVTIQSGSGGCYTGTYAGIYRIVAADIRSAKVIIPKQVYTGKEIMLEKSQITIKLAGKTLQPEDFEIVQYTNNIKKGKGSVMLRGTGNYGGTKIVTFSIGAKAFWW